ncbi:39S ribosomal protein L36, mitochondrial [Oryzias latipes]|uniref:Ribosomal protein n=1 Tax=Oryzias latipes TaxID=8090 RepID=H2MH01_ORYLA|nr:39S ribosomal protein L36, mitochondrial [Oryzias latipes]
MAPLVLKHLASALARQMSVFRGSSLAALRCFSRPPTLPPLLLPASSSCGPLAQVATSLLGRCQHHPCIQPTAGMKTKSALKRRCKDCFFVRRRGHLFVFCKTNPRHKQRQG